MSKNNDDKNQNDPFNFFNFGPDSDGDDKKSPKKPFFSLWLLAPLVVVIFILLNQLMILNSSALIPFSEFKDRITSGQIKKVVLGPVYFTGYTSIQDDDASNTSLFSFLSVQKNTNEYVTVGIYTSEFLQLLDDHHVFIM